MRAYNHALAWNGAARLAARWHRPWQTPESMVGCMAAVPLPRRLGTADTAAAQRVRNALWFDHGIEVAVLARDGVLWARVSAQVYNDDEDLERLAHAVDALARH
jgi:isopenicillin-N epimerase